MNYDKIIDLEKMEIFWVMLTFLANWDNYFLMILFDIVVTLSATVIAVIDIGSNKECLEL